MNSKKPFAFFQAIFYTPRLTFPVSIYSGRNWENQTHSRLSKIPGEPLVQGQQKKVGRAWHRQEIKVPKLLSYVYFSNTTGVQEVLIDKKPTPTETWNSKNPCFCRNFFCWKNGQMIDRREKVLYYIILTPLMYLWIKIWYKFGM